MLFYFAAPTLLLSLHSVGQPHRKAVLHPMSQPGQVIEKGKPIISPLGLRFITLPLPLSHVL